MINESLKNALFGHNDNTYKDFTENITYKDFTYKDFTYKDLTYKDFTYNDLIHNINKCYIKNILSKISNR